ncbi:hypothetical protein AAY473_003255 [Plecturocebus cupreus]
MENQAHNTMGVTKLDKFFQFLVSEEEIKFCSVTQTGVQLCDLGSLQCQPPGLKQFSTLTS